MKNVSKETIIRTIALVLSIVNYILTSKGMNPLPFGETEAYEFISMIAMGAASIWAWWKNNSFTKEAIAADKILDDLKTENKEQ